MRHFDLTPPEPEIRLDGMEVRLGEIDDRLDAIEDKLELMALHMEALYEAIKAKGTDYEATVN